MNVRSDYMSGHLTIHMSGELDHHTAQDAFLEAERTMDRYLPRSCALDLSELSFMDSSGIAVAIRLDRRMREAEGSFWLADPAPQPARVLNTSGIGRLITIKSREGDTRK